MEMEARLLRAEEARELVKNWVKAKLKNSIGFAYRKAGPVCCIHLLARRPQCDLT
jgi:hypothetical protein